MMSTGLSNNTSCFTTHNRQTADAHILITRGYLEEDILRKRQFEIEERSYTTPRSYHLHFATSVISRLGTKYTALLDTKMAYGP